MNAPVNLEASVVLLHDNTEQYEKCLQTSKRINWDIEKDVIRGRKLDFSKVFLPDGLSQVSNIQFLSDNERKLLSQIQGRTYANVFGLVERFICTKMLEISQDYMLDDQVALEALLNFGEEELKHQELFRRLDQMADSQMPLGYHFAPDPNEVAKAVLGKSNWAVLGLTLHIELFTQIHYKESIAKENDLCPLWKDVFKFHWLEESQHAIIDAIEWQNEDIKLSVEERDRAVDDFIELVGAVDNILQTQANEDVNYFIKLCDFRFNIEQIAQLHNALLAAYRWQYIFSGAVVPRFVEVLSGMITNEQSNRIGDALGSIQ